MSIFSSKIRTDSSNDLGILSNISDHIYGTSLPLMLCVIIGACPDRG